MPIISGTKITKIGANKRFIGFIKYLNGDFSRFAEQDLTPPVSDELHTVLYVAVLYGSLPGYYTVYTGTKYFLVQYLLVI